MRIAIVTEVWHPTTNGVVTRLTATIDQLLAEGHQVLVIAPAIGTNALGDNGSGLTVRTVPTLHLRFVYGGQPWGLPLPRVARYLAQFDPDVVHVVNPAVLGIVGVIAARRQKRPLVCSYHTDLAAYASYYHLGWLRPIIWWIQRKVYGAAELTMVTSERSRTQLLDAGIQSVCLWPRAVDLDRFTPGRTDSAAWPLIALYVGRLAEEKQLDGLSELTSLPDTHLVVAGDGPSRARLQQKWASGSVTFRGFLDGAELASVYQQSDVFVFPSTTETLGLVLIEALASGLPVVAADSPASREVLSGCAAARLYTPGPGAVGAAISELLASASRSALSRQARAHVAGQTWAGATHRLTAAYDTVLHGRQRQGSDLHRQIGRFLTVGASNAVIDLGVFNLLDVINRTSSSLTLVAYNTVAVLLALANSYWWNSRWTFRRRAARVSGPERRRQRILFGLQGALNLAVNDAVVAVASAALLTSGLLAPVVAANAAKLTGMLATSLASFAICHKIVFRHRSGDRARRGARTKDLVRQ